MTKTKMTQKINIIKSGAALMAQQMQHLTILVHVVRSKISLTKMIRSHGMELGCENCHVRILSHDPVPGIRGAEKVDQDDVVLRHIMVLEHLHSFAHFVPRPHDGIEEENLSCGNIIRKLGKYNMSFMSLRVTVNQDFTNPHTSAAFLKSFLHSLAGSDNGYPTVPLFILEPGISTACWSNNFTILVWKLIQTLFNYHPY